GDWSSDVCSSDLATDPVRKPAEEDKRRRGDEQRDPGNNGWVENVWLHDLLDEVERPELAAIPHDPLPDHDDAGNQDVFDVLTPEGLAPWIGRRLSLRLDGLEDRRLLELQAVVDGARGRE